MCAPIPLLQHSKKVARYCKVTSKCAKTENTFTVKFFDTWSCAVYFNERWSSKYCIVTTDDQLKYLYLLLQPTYLSRQNSRNTTFHFPQLLHDFPTERPFPTTFQVQKFQTLNSATNTGFPEFVQTPSIIQQMALDPNFYSRKPPTYTATSVQLRIYWYITKNVHVVHNNNKKNTTKNTHNTTQPNGPEI